MNPVRDLSSAHHQRSPSDYIDIHTTQTVTCHPRLQFPLSIALITHTHTAATYQTHYISPGLPLSDRRVLSVTWRLRRETCGSICIALFTDMVKIQAGSNTSNQVWHRRDTRVRVGWSTANLILRARRTGNPQTEESPGEVQTQSETAMQRVNPRQAISYRAGRDQTGWGKPG